MSNKQAFHPYIEEVAGESQVAPRAVEALPIATAGLLGFAIRDYQGMSRGTTSVWPAETSAKSLANESWRR